ncbi:MAG: hypothetical protein LIO97_04190 [Tannerellaceae bacterium]|nr:hypothetical protein [Tannerellaceae bacterium]
MEKEIETQKTTITDNQKSYEKENNKLKNILKRIFTLFPYIKELLRMETLCKAIDFTTEITLKLISLQPVKFSGNLYSEQYRRKYETENSIAKIEKEPHTTNRLRLSIDNLHVSDWFRKKHTEEQSLKQSPCNKKKGMKL